MTNASVCEPRMPGTDAVITAMPSIAASRLPVRVRPAAMSPYTAKVAHAIQNAT